MSARYARLLRFALATGLAASAAGGCSSLDGPPPPLGPRAEPTPRAQAVAGSRPGAHVSRVGRYVFHTDFPLDTRDPLLRGLEELPDQIETALLLPASDSLIQVFLFDAEEAYHAFLRAKDPKLPLRSAYFFAEPARGLGGGPPELHVYTWTSKRLEVDLRHELTHALLHGVLKTVPLWLDEGLAGYFEQPPANGGVNVAHLQALQAVDPGGERFRADLARLEKLKSVEQMGRAEYQEAWAWVHYMLHAHADTRQVLLSYLQALRTTATPGLLLPKLEAVVGDAGPRLTAHLTGLEQASRVRPAGR